MRLVPALPLAPAVIMLSVHLAIAATGPRGDVNHPVSADAPGVTSILLDSEPGEFIGGGQFYFFTADDGVLEVAPSVPTTPGDIFLHFVSPRDLSASLAFTAPVGEALAVGVYEDAVQPYRRGPGQPGLQVDTAADGIGRGCIGTFGRFEVKQVAFDAGGTLTAFWAAFEQTCEGKVLRGEVRLHAEVPVVLAAPSRRSAQEGHELSFPVAGHDLSGSPVALSATAMPEGAAFTDAGDGTGRFAWTPDVGQAGRYWMAIHGASIAGDSDAVYTRIDTFPDFDDFDTPIAITGPPFWLQVEDPQASHAPDDPATCFGPAGVTIWYSLTPAADARMQFYSQVSGNAPDATVVVFSGERGALEPIACGLHFARADVVAGRDYHVMLSDPETAPTQWLEVDALPPPPANDTFAAATVVTALPFSETIEVGGARAELGVDPGMCGVGSFDQSPNVWYSFTPDHDLRLTVDTTGGPMPETVSAFTGAYGALVPAGCDRSRLNLTARAGQTYYLMMSGPVIPLEVTLRVSITGAPILGVEMTVAPDGTVDPRSGQAVVRGIATCSRPAQITLSGELHQFRAQADGRFETTIACTGSTRWSAAVAADPGGGRRPIRFTHGPGDLIYRADATPLDNPVDTVAIDLRHAAIVLRMARSR